MESQAREALASGPILSQANANQILAFIGMMLREIARLETQGLVDRIGERRAVKDLQKMFSRYVAEKQAREAAEARLASLTGRPAEADALISGVAEFLRSQAGPRCRTCLMNETAHRYNCRLVSWLDQIATFFRAE